MGFEIDRKDLIEGLGKGLRVIEAFDDQHPRLTPSDTAARAGITRTAARRYLLSLVHFGYAETDGKQFWLTARVLRLANSFLTASRIARLVQPFIQHASMQSGETVNVSVLDGHDVVYLARSNSPRLVSIGFQTGARAPAHVVAPGVAILSTYTDAALDAWLSEHSFSSFTAHTVTDRQVFKDHVLAARQMDHWIAEQQLDVGLRGLAVVLRDLHGECRGAVSMTVPAQPYTPAQITERLLPLLREAANAMRPVL